MGQGGDHNITALRLPHRTHTQTTTPRLVKRENVLARCDDFRIGGKVGRLNMLTQLSHRGFG